jgi:hypothetical protein
MISLPLNAISLKLFVAVGNAELSNMMASCATHHQGFVIEPFILLVVLQLLWRENIVESFKPTGSVRDKRAKGHKLSATVRTEDVSAAREGIRAGAEKLRRLAQPIGLSTSPAWRVWT